MELAENEKFVWIYFVLSVFTKALRRSIYCKYVRGNTSVKVLKFPKKYFEI